MSAPQSITAPPTIPQRPRRPTPAERRLLRATPRLDARFPVLLRGDGTVQIGTSPDRAVVVTPPSGVPPRPLAELLRRLDGSTRFGRALRHTRLPLSRTQPVLDELARAGLITAGPERRVPRCAVTVHGAGPLSERLREHLPAIGVQVHSSGVLPHSAGQVDAAASSVVVLADHSVVEPCVRRALHEAAMPHMQIHLRDGTGVIGPLIVPGMTGCLDCGDLYRSERDPAWPRLMLQQIGLRGRADPPTTMVTVGVAAARIRAFLLGPPRPASEHAHHERSRPGSAQPDRAPMPPGLQSMVQVASGAAAMTAQPWPAHPECRCRAAADRHALPRGGPYGGLRPPDGRPQHRATGDDVPSGAGS